MLLQRLARAAALQGILVDSQGGGVPNAKVVAFDEGKQLMVREVVSAGDGSFQLLALSRGVYTVKAEISGG